jgi:hypothetical protein
MALSGIALRKNCFLPKYHNLESDSRPSCNKSQYLGPELLKTRSGEQRLLFDFINPATLPS